MKTTLIAALLCTTNVLLPCAHAQQSDADTNQLALVRAKAVPGNAHSQFALGQGNGRPMPGLNSTNHPPNEIATIRKLTKHLL